MPYTSSYINKDLALMNLCERIIIDQNNKNLRRLHFCYLSRISQGDVQIVCGRVYLKNEGTWRRAPAELVRSVAKFYHAGFIRMDGNFVALTQEGVALLDQLAEKFK